MKDDECVRFLQWALPKLHLRWPGFRKVRRQVCKRINRRLNDLGLADIDAYRLFLESHPFHLILCRNLAFTYFDNALQNEVLSRILSVLISGGVLVIGRHETLPSRGGELLPLRPDLGFYRKP